MKKNNLFLGLAFASVIVLSACEKDEDAGPKDEPVVYGAINTYTDVKFGAQKNNLLGSCFSSGTGTIYTIANAYSESDTIDLVYLYGENENFATLGAPSDALVQSTFSNSIPNWDSLNTSYFHLTSLTATQFNAATNDSLVLNGVNLDSLNIATHISDLSIGNVVAFKTKHAKLGLIHITNIGGTSELNREMTVQVKIQK